MNIVPDESADDPSYKADRWNLAHAVGTEVEVTKDNGATERTHTTSPAWVLGGHTPVIRLNGIVGCYDLDRVKAVTKGAAS